MSREIKFRAWLKEEEKTVNVSLMSLTGKWIGYQIFYEEEKKKKFEFSDSENFKLMQYTGLKDSLGNEIYKGDILWNEYDEEHQVIIYDEGEYKLMGESHIQNLYNNLYYIDVRGNVYENFELVKGWYKKED